MKIIPTPVRAQIIRFCRDVFGRRAVRAEFSRPPITAPVSLHMVLGRDTLLMGMLAMRSLEFHTGQSWQPFIHEDGSLQDADVAEFQSLFPDARIIRRAEADAVMKEALAGYPASRENRMKHNWFLKFFDTRHYAPHDRYIVIDSDIVFFKRPDFVLRWIAEKRDDFWFMEDTNEKYASPREDLEAALGFPLWHKVNSGLDLMYRPGVSLELAERFLATCAESARYFQFLEQSLFAVTGSAWKRGGVLPPEYEISWGNFKSRDAVMRHYVATFKHDLLYVEGATSFFFQTRTRRAAPSHSTSHA